MRVWLDPHKLNRVQMTPADIQAAIRPRMPRSPSASWGGAPVSDQQFTATIKGQTRLSTVEEFNNILLRVNRGRLKGPAQRTWPGSSWPAKATTPPRSGNGQATGGGRHQAGAPVPTPWTPPSTCGPSWVNSPVLPANMEIVYPYDTTPFVKISIEEVVQT